jgi:predicted alpha/beta hydrolase family esterase
MLMIPGYGGSGAGHWQTLWEHENPAIRRVEQSDWDNPELEAWVSNLAGEITACDRPPVLIAHSLGCATVAHFAAREPRSLAGALLVAPVDLEIIADWYPELAGFSPMPFARLEFPTIVVASSDDMYVTVDRAREFADSWGAEFVTVEGGGHINVDSGHGPWPEGKALLQRLIASL